MALSPVLDLPVRQQSLGVDIESIAPVTGFTPESRDYANVNGILLVENPEAKKYVLVVPFPVEKGSAEVRVVSTGKRVEFKKPRGPKPADFVEFLRRIGTIPSDQEPVLAEIKKAIRDFVVAEVEIPAGQQVLRFHARQELAPAADNPKSFRLELFAPLAGFILSPSGQVMMSVTVAFPATFAASTLQIGTPEIVALPNQAAPAAQPSGPCDVAQRKIYGWLWQQDPKLIIPYSYS